MLSSYLGVQNSFMSQLSSESKIEVSSPLVQTSIELLRIAFSKRSTISPTSSLAEFMNLAKHISIQELQEYRIIGEGTCGTIFELPGKEIVIKKGSNVEALWKDFQFVDIVYNSIEESRSFLQDAFPDATIPRCPRCLKFRGPRATQYWQENLENFPASHREVSVAFEFDRILPLPKAVRDSLISLFFDDRIEKQREAKEAEENKSCLVRVYLGENGNEKLQSTFYDSLRNFPLRLNMMEETDMDVFALAREMAMALAILHWKARVDAMDTEFVLGSKAAKSDERRVWHIGDDHKLLPLLDTFDIPTFTERSIHLWILDFDKANLIEFTPHNVDTKLVPGFLGNDPYYPRPDVDIDLWNEFSNVYLAASQLILQKQKATEAMDLPKRFLEKVMEKIKELETWDPETHIIFED